MTPWAAWWEPQHMGTALKGSHFPSLLRQCHKSFTNWDQVWILVVLVWTELLMEETPVPVSCLSAEQMLLCPTHLWIKFNLQLFRSYLEWSWALGHREDPPAGEGWSQMTFQFRGKNESLQIKKWPVLGAASQGNRVQFIQAVNSLIRVVYYVYAVLQFSSAMLGSSLILTVSHFKGTNAAVFPLSPLLWSTFFLVLPLLTTPAA